MRSHRHRSVYGYRAKLGLITPPTNTVNEPEWARMLPDGVSFHTVRMPIHLDTHSREGRKALIEDMIGKVRELRKAEVDVVAYACTAGSMINPRHALAREIEAATGTPLVTTAASIVDALERLGARRISIATPYHDGINAHEIDFLAGNGIEALKIAGLGLGARGLESFDEFAKTPLEKVEAHARAAFVAGSEALLITCTDFPTLPFLARLEQDLGVPVVTSNSATLWATLRQTGIADKLERCGRLLTL